MLCDLSFENTSTRPMRGISLVETSSRRNAFRTLDSLSMLSATSSDAPAIAAAIFGREASVAPRRSQTASQSANTGYPNHFPRALSTAALSIPARDILVSKTGTSNLLEEEMGTYHDLRERLESMDQKALYKLCRTEINQRFTRLYAIRGTRLGLTGKGRESPERRHQGHKPSNVVRVKERRDTAKRGELHDPARPLAASLVLPGLCCSASRELTNCTAMAAPRLLPVTSTLSGGAP